MIRYAAIEGIDGSGKDTQIALLAVHLDRRGITPIVLHEPSYGKHGRAIRATLQDLLPDVGKQRALFTRDREDHVKRKIGPALAFVREHPAFMLLQNRSLLSAAAYQPLGEEDNDLRRAVTDQLAIAPMPDRIVILDIPIEVALARIARRGLPDVFERAEALTAIRRRYLRLAELYPQCVLVDATGAPPAVGAAMLKALDAP